MADGDHITCPSTYSVDYHGDTSTTYTSNTFSTGTWTYWSNWVDTSYTATATTTTATSNIVWPIWCESHTVGNVVVSQRDDESWRERQRIRNTKDRIKSARVKRTATSLLRCVVGEALFQEWVRHGSIRFPGSDGGLFEVNPEWIGMVYELDPDTKEPKRKLCVHPSSRFPVEDRVAALYLGLTTDQRKIIEKANVHGFAERERERISMRRRGGRRPAAYVGAACN